MTKHVLPYLNYLMTDFPVLEHDKSEALHTMLAIILDHVDYTNGSCQPNEQVAACLPLDILERAKKLLVITS